MTLWDDRILEVIREIGAERVGNLVDHDDIRISQSQVSRRCQKLADNGLLQALGNGVYVLTDEGEAYLDGEYDAEDGAYLNAGETQNGPTADGVTES